MVIVLYNRRRVFVAASGQDGCIPDAALRSQQWSCGWGWLSPGAIIPFGCYIPVRTRPG